MVYYNNTNELCHHGVLGMKWGMRRYQRKDGSLTAAGKRHLEKTGEVGSVYKSHATKKYTRKMNRALKKGNAFKAAIYENRMKNAQKLDKREQDYAKSVSAGGNIVTRILTGGRIGGKGYQMHLAMSKRVKQDFPAKFGAFLATSLTGGRLIGGNIRKAHRLREGESDLKKKMRAENAKKSMEKK